MTGEVRAREPQNVNPNLPTGEIEVVATSIEVLNEAAPLPFQVDEHTEVGEEVRLKYRYLDLRRPGPAAAIRLRSQVNRAARETLYEQGFVEIETPTMTRSTPEGARDFVVPARLRPGSWYALPQSPQLFKQLLMVGGMERYFQIARCYRDEDFRADRQPEFTQLDIEMSFVDQDDVIAMAESVLVALWQLIGYDVPTPIPRMPYAEAMAALRLGQARPALRRRTRRLHRLLRRHPVPGVPGAVRRRRRDVRRRVPAAAHARRAGRSSPSSAGTAGSRTSSSRTTARSAARSPRTCPTPSGTASPRTSARSPGDCVFFAAGPASVRPRAARRHAARDRQAARPDRRVGVVVRLDRRRAAVRAVVGRGRRR